MKNPKVFLTGGDLGGWALDEDLRLTKRALESVVELTDLEHCEVVHSVWWEPLLEIPHSRLGDKPIICHMSGEPYRYMSLPRYRHAARLVDCWIAQTKQAARECSSVGIPHTFIPYTTDVGLFRPLSEGDPSLVALRTQWNIPEGQYLIGNFHRDTEGFDLRVPKRIKGPDIFAELVGALWKRGCPVHVVLAGPRRHWLRSELARIGVPFTFVGRLDEKDDLGGNLLPHETLNTLYNLLDMYVISSRSEGGPRSLMEAAAARCKVISTRVGLAEDILDPACIYTSPVHAVRLLAQDMETNQLAASVDLHYERVTSHHRPESVVPSLISLYENLKSYCLRAETRRVVNGERPESRPRTPGVIDWVVSVFQRSKPRIGLWHRFFAPPYGGGNQFMLALRKALQLRGISVVENQLRSDVDAYLLNSIHFDVERFMNFSRRHRLQVVHRIDGPIHLIRGGDCEKDELCFNLNSRFASTTVLQSAWTHQRIVEMGYRPINPVIIRNAVDPDIFHPRGRVPFDPSRKIRLIATSWSDNPRKGGPIYKWIEAQLDWDRFEFTFVGNCSERFARIRCIPPVPSDELASILRQHDIYITASRNDPCSNAVLEALACGLPVLYLNDGGHPELVGYGGLPFHDQEDIIPQLAIMADNYEMFQRLIVVPTMDEVAEKYLALLMEVA